MPITNKEIKEMIKAFKNMKIKNPKTKEAKTQNKVVNKIIKKLKRGLRWDSENTTDQKDK